MMTFTSGFEKRKKELLPCQIITSDRLNNGGAVAAGRGLRKWQSEICLLKILDKLDPLSYPRVTDPSSVPLRFDPLGNYCCSVFLCIIFFNGLCSSMHFRPSFYLPIIVVIYDFD
ncbi:hypothetical protein Nepgr_016864 [Nepenthes gracilis]|uniref:Uncharacterized protein n=1 Tax=Nepenthes gracilis TaxID=150966 RepID=A0AAD3SPC0_NEPGR|nr:hypothetical protein Nepgr_016864 [Nepenthes gracilis]